MVGFTFGGVGPYTGFVLHPDGYTDFLTVPAQPLLSEQECVAETIPDGINAAGMIAGWYLNYIDCTTLNTGGFVMSPDGVFTLFQPPGTMVTSLRGLSTRIRIRSASTRLGTSRAPTRTRLGSSTVLYAILMEPSPPSIRRRANRPPRPASTMEARSPASIITIRAADPRWALSAYRSRLA